MSRKGEDALIEAIIAILYMISIGVLIELADRYSWTAVLGGLTIIGLFVWLLTSASHG